MKYFVSLLFVALSLAGCSKSPGLKAGLWEVKQTKQVMDGQDVRAQMEAAQAEVQRAMAAMPPAQRKQMEAMMGERGFSMPEADGTIRICISPEMAASDQPIIDPEGQCPPAKTSRSGNKMSYEFECTRKGTTMAGKGENVYAGDLVTSRMEAVATDARGRHTMENESEMRYLGSDCQGLKPLALPAGSKKD